jgi:DnaJ-class molecular chaperone
VRELATCGIIAKGIQTEAALLEAIQQGLQQAPTVRLETDMRAHMNPTRMEVIAQLAAQLATRIATPCPACQTPGFGEKGVEGHLVCENCGTQTELYAQRVLKCIRCEHKSFWPREDGLSKASPQYCPHCNP